MYSRIAVPTLALVPCEQISTVASVEAGVTDALIDLVFAVLASVAMVTGAVESIDHVL